MTQHPTNTTKRKDRLQVWLCTKFNEVHLIRRYGFNKYIAATYIEGLDEWIDITWPRPNRNNDWHYIGGYL